MNDYLNSVVQIICSQGSPAFSKMSAGTGWFAKLDNSNLSDRHIITNAHVINGAQGVFIRLANEHKTDIQVSVLGVSTDLDIAVLELSEDAFERVKKITRGIKPFEIGNSDELIKEGYRGLITLGYPLGTENQMKTYGNYSGLKHAAGLEQLYITSDAAINPGSSGGPFVHQRVRSDGTLEDPKVYGMNTMKVSGAELVSMHIPSNRIKRALPYLIDNSKNKELIQSYIALAKAMHGQAAIKSHNLEEFTDHVANSLLGEDIDAVKMVSHWKDHALGGYKRTKDGVEKVSFGEWYAKHVIQGKGGHSVMRHVSDLIHRDDIDQIHELRKVGFHTKRCASCKDNKCRAMDVQLKVGKYTVPPTVVHMPRIGVRFSNSTPDVTSKHYNIEGDVTGVVLSTVVDGGLFSNNGLQKDDFVFQIDVNGTSHDIDNNGESWFPDLNVRLPVVDIIHRSEVGQPVTVHYYRNGQSQQKEFKYNFLDQNTAPQIRCLDSLQDMGLARQMATVGGVVLTPLRLNHVQMFKLRKYMDPREQNKFKIVVADLAVGSPAFLTKNIMPGDVLTHINDEPIHERWSGTVKQFSSEQDYLKDVNANQSKLVAKASGNGKNMFVTQREDGFLNQLQQLKPGQTVKFESERGVTLVLKV